jgi:hypothetical protein
MEQKRLLKNKAKGSFVISEMAKRGNKLLLVTEKMAKEVVIMGFFPIF